MPARIRYPPYIFGLHDPGGEHLMLEAGRPGWVLVTEAIGANPNDRSGGDYRYLSDRGLGVIVRLNNAYHPGGTIPHSSHYRDFARRCGNFVENSQGCHIWIIGNEPNLPWERPGGEGGEVITPELYARCFLLCRNEIRSRRGHEHDQVVVAAVGPWNNQTTYPGNPSGDWVKYFRDVLDRLNGRCDGIALHTYTNGYSLDFIKRDFWQGQPGYTHLRYQFRTYIDFMEAIPQDLRHLPVYITETDQNVEWRNENIGWVQAAYAEIERWNSDPANQPIQALILYRWPLVPDQPQWAISTRPGVIEDFKAAMRHEYRVRPPRPLYRARWLEVRVPARIGAGQRATATVRVRNEGAKTWFKSRVCLGYRWYTSAGQELDLEDVRTPLPHDVKPGQEVTFAQASVQAPPAPGRYILRWDMVEEPETWFWKKGSPREDVAVEVGEALPKYGVSWLEAQVPKTLSPDAVAAASFRLRNEGAKTWARDGPRPVHLAYNWFTPSGQLAGCWDTFRAPLPADVAPGEEVTLSGVALKTPAAPGQYLLRWDLVEEGVTWFSKEGASPLEMAVEVVVGGISSAPWRAQASHNQADVAKAFDGNPDTFWSSQAKQEPGMWYELDLGQPQLIERIRVGSPGRGFPVGYILSVSVDGQNWEVVDRKPHNWKSIEVVFAPRQVRYIRIEQTGTPSWTAFWLISEISIGLAHP